MLNLSPRRKKMERNREQIQEERMTENLPDVMTDINH